MIKHPINCSTTHRRLAMLSRDGIHLWCSRCNVEHVVSREEINRMWTQLDEQQSRQEASVK
jgi:hypothetical protein